MEELQNVETVELDADRWIMLEFYRRWPRYILAWSIRQRAGDTDFPVAQGELERLPREGVTADEIWDELRQEGKAAAMQSAGTSQPAPPEPEKKGLFSRLFGGN